MLENIKSIFWVKKKEAKFIPLYSGWLNSLFQKNKNLNQSELLNLYTGYSYVCISAISQWIAGLQRELFTDENENEILKHYYFNLIDEEFLENLIWMLEITGIAYIRKIYFWKSIDKLEVLRSDLIYKKQDSNFYRYIDNGKVIEIPENQIFYIKSFSPFLSKNWFSPLQAIANQQLMDDLIMKWNMSFFKNGASSWTTLTTDQAISKEDKEYIISKWKTEFMGAENAHKVAVLDHWLRQEKADIWQKELDFVNQRTMIRDEIFTIFRVPKVIVWITDGVWYTDRLIWKQNFSEYVLNPLAKKIEKALNENVFKGVWIFRFVNVVPIDFEQLAKDYQLWVITLDEYRIQAGYSNVKNWDRNFFWETFEDENNWNYISTRDNEEKTVLKKLESNIKKSLENIDKKKEINELNEEKEKKLSARRTKKIKRTDEYEKQLQIKLKKLFKLQENQILQVVDKKTLDELWKIKKVDLWNEKAMTILTSQLLKPVFGKIFEVENKDELNYIEQLKLNEYSENVIWELSNWVLTKEKLLKAFDREIKVFVWINAETQKEIMQLIKEWYKEGLWYEKITEKITEKFADYSKNRINKIARTEVSRAVNQTRLDTRAELWSVKEKEWYTALDERTCESCSHIHWKKIPLQANFYNLWDRDFAWTILKYDDINQPPLHPNCRCDLVPIF